MKEAQKPSGTENRKHRRPEIQNARFEKPRSGGHEGVLASGLQAFARGSRSGGG
jgi:hypothetical protein